MKKIISVLVFCIVCFPCSCQERIDRVDLVYVDSSDVIESAIGWCYNDLDGKWVDNSNCIVPYKDESGKISSYAYTEFWAFAKYKEQRFNSIRVKKCLFYGEYYYVVIVNRWEWEREEIWNRERLDFDYKYEKYRKDYCYLLSVGEYDALFNLTEYPLVIRAICEHDVSDWERVDGRAKEVEFLSSCLERRGGGRNEGFIPLIKGYKSSEGKIRFIFGSYIPDIKECYFEISEEEWNKLKI